MPRKQRDPKVRIDVTLTPALRHYFETGEYPGSTPQSCGLYGWVHMQLEILDADDPELAMAPYREAWEQETGRTAAPPLPFPADDDEPDDVA